MDPVVPHRVKDLSGRVGLDIVARGHHDEPNGGEKHAEKISLGSAKDIKDLCKGQVGDTADDAAQNGDGRCERVLREGGGDIGIQGSGGPRQHALDKVGQPDHDIGEDQGFGRPCHGHGLDLLDTGLGMGIHGGLVSMVAGVGVRGHSILQVVDKAGVLLFMVVGWRRHDLLLEEGEKSC